MKTLLLLLVLAASGAFAQSLTLTWVAGAGSSTANTTSFQVQEATTTGGPYTTIGTVAYVSGQSTYTFTWSGGVNGTIYFFVQEAIGPGGTSAPSPESMATFPFAPPPVPGKATITANP